MKLAPRSNLQNKKPRCHYNKRGKNKMSFETEEDAIKYIKKMNLKDYIVYLCKVCNKYHISHKRNEINKETLERRNKST